MRKLILSLLLLSLSALPAFAHCGMCGVGDKKDAGSMADKKVEAMTAELGLSEEQATQLKAIMNEKMEKKSALHEKQTAEMDAVKEEYKSKLKSVLTEEQLKQYESMKETKTCPMCGKAGKDCECSKKDKDGKVCPMCGKAGKDCACHKHGHDHKHE